MYDFLTCPDRTKSFSYKYKDMFDKNPDIPEGVIPFSVADMEFKNAPEIIEGLKKYIENTVLGYTAPSDGFIEAVCGWMEKRHDYHIEKEWIALSDGVVPALSDLIRSTTDEGDGVIILTPVYYPFKGSIEKNNRKVVNVDLLHDDSSYTIDFDGLKKAAADKNNKLIIFCNPHNPVGRVWTKEELKQVYDICVSNDVFIISDEIHNDLIMPGYEHTVMANVAEDAGKHMAVCTAPSKSFNLAGLQTSCIIIEDEDRRKAFINSRAKGHRGVVNALGMEACRVAYTECEKWLDECIEVIDGNAKYMKSFLNEHFPEVKVYPLEGTYLLWCDFGAYGLSCSELEEFNIKDALLFTDEGYLFGEAGKGFERFNIACPRHKLEEAMQRLLNNSDKIRR
ncbi:MalY/PatB family protein [Butyrivibrio sp. AE3006]|uniref:MalY/PatB family protein n=1 Tax=Butyrivibrio sp. AE3006 TaxID=1280673 RepID=UPI00040EACF3|nr:MalY/PatB family protein [Butyrivibrio sp. AE3006]